MMITFVVATHISLYIYRVTYSVAYLIDDYYIYIKKSHPIRQTDVNK